MENEVESAYHGFNSKYLIHIQCDLVPDPKVVKNIMVRRGAIYFKVLWVKTKWQSYL